MATAYPGALDATNNQLRTDISSTDDLDESGKEHDVMHVNAHGAVVELETKLGTGSSTASSGAVMMGTGSGTSAWDTSPTILGALTIGADGAGHDVTFHSDTAGDALVWDSSAESLTITGTNAQTALAVADGNVTMADDLTVTGGIVGGSVVAPIAFNAQSGTTYTFVIGDAGKLVTSSNGSAQTFTVPPNSSVAFATGTQIIVQNIGSANCTLAQGSGVTITSVDSSKEIDGQYASACLIKTATDAWTLIGKLA